VRLNSSAADAGCAVVRCPDVTVDGFSKSDEMLMGKKINYLSGVAPHGNIVKFIGEVDDGGADGPTSSFPSSSSSSSSSFN